jgi:hypothetical protein
VSLEHLWKIFLSILVMTHGAYAQTPMCISYLHHGEIHVRCGGVERTLLRRPGLSMYAMDGDRIAIVIAKTEAAGNRHRLTEKESVLLLANGKEQTIELPASVAFLYASCGTILANLRDQRGSTWDIVADQPVEFTSLRRPACNAARTYIIGIDSNGDLAESSGSVLAQSGHFGHYAVSRSGAAAALLRQPDDDIYRVCTLSPSARKAEQCHRVEASNNGGISVNDDGNALFVQLTDATCYWVDGEMTTKIIRGGSPNQCFAAAVTSTDGVPKIVAILGDQPSWVTGGPDAVKPGSSR